MTNPPTGTVYKIPVPSILNHTQNYKKNRIQNNVILLKIISQFFSWRNDGFVKQFFHIFLCKFFHTEYRTYSGVTSLKKCTLERNAGTFPFFS